MTWYRTNGSVPSVAESRSTIFMEPTEKMRYGSRQAGQRMLFALPQLGLLSLCLSVLARLENVDAEASSTEYSHVV